MLEPGFLLEKANVGCHLTEEELFILLGKGKNGKPNFGKLIKEQRLKLGWSREKLAQLYGSVVKGEPVTEKAIEIMEEYNLVPANLKRRSVLAALLSIPPALLGVPTDREVLSHFEAPSFLSRNIDIEEYRTTLAKYQNRHLAATDIDLLRKIRYRIFRLQDAFYPNAQPDNEIGQLLCGYLILMGNVAKELFYFDTALSALDQIITLADTYEYHQLRASALYRRGGVYIDMATVESTWGNQAVAHSHFKAATNDFDEALLLSSFIPPQMQGTILVASCSAQAHLAVDQDAMSEMQEQLDAAEKTIDDKESKRGLDFMPCTTERYLLDRAAALVGSPDKALHKPGEAISYLKGIPATSGPRRQAYYNVLHAKAAFAEGNYGFATTLAADALIIAEGVQSKVNLARIDGVYRAIGETNYRTTESFAQLGVALMRAKHPELFPSREVY